MLLDEGEGWAWLTNHDEYDAGGGDVSVFVNMLGEECDLNPDTVGKHVYYIVSFSGETDSDSDSDSDSD